MNRNLLIVGAGIYGVVAKEVAESMGCFEKIAFVDDSRNETPDGTAVIGTCADMERLAGQYSHIIVAIGNPQIRLSLIEMLEKNGKYKIATLISPRAYVAASAAVMHGSVIEPMAVIHSCARISAGCLISAGAVINHAGQCDRGVHVDCNATVAGMTVVPAGTTVKSGQVYQ